MSGQDLYRNASISRCFPSWRFEKALRSDRVTTKPPGPHKASPVGAAHALARGFSVLSFFSAADGYPGLARLMACAFKEGLR